MELEPERLAPEDAEPAGLRVDEDRHGDGRGHAEAEDCRTAPAVAVRSREEARERERCELRGRAEPDQKAAAHRRRDRDECPDHEQRHQSVVRVRHEVQEGERRRGPDEGEHHAETAAVFARTEAAAEHEQPGDRQQVEGDRRGVRGRQVIVPQVVEREDQLERQVREVGDRAVRVEVVVVRDVQRPTVVDVARAVDRRVADVADTAEEEVRDEPGHDEADQRGRDEARAAACRERAVVPRPAKAEEGQPHAQVEQWRVNERHADERPVVVEERDRGAE